MKEKIDYTDLKAWLTFDEGRILHEYPDSNGIPTIGIGHNLIARPIAFLNDRDIKYITDEECDEIFHVDVEDIVGELSQKIQWINTVDLIIRNALINMAFNNGVHGLLGFTTFLALIKSKAYKEAADDLRHTKDGLNPKLHDRYERIAKAIESVCPTMTNS